VSYNPKLRLWNFALTARAGYLYKTIDIYSRRGAENAENNYRNKRRVTRDNEKTKTIFTLLTLGED
jgi:hypothetical protein